MVILTVNRIEEDGSLSVDQYATSSLDQTREFILDDIAASYRVARERMDDNLEIFMLGMDYCRDLLTADKISPDFVPGRILGYRCSYEIMYCA